MSDDHEWWRQAQTLESEGRLEEAERLINDAVPHIGFAASLAELYAYRMARLQDAGDEAGAVEAFHQADRWIGLYASMATSGGEGAALSLQRDRFRRSLVSRLGYDPEQH